MIEVKPCPFCGRKKAQITRKVGVTFMRCSGCGATGPHAGGDTKKGASEAIRLWNDAPRR